MQGARVLPLQILTPSFRLARAVSSRLVVIQSDDVVLDRSGATSMTKSSLATAHSTLGRLYVL